MDVMTKQVEPKDVVMPFGKYKGRTIDEIGGTDDGLFYLIWAARVPGYDPTGTKEAMLAYLADPAVAERATHMGGSMTGRG